MSIFDTIGPFIVEPDVDWPTDDLGIVSVDGEKQIATVLGNGEKETATANLFAASPKLLAALQALHIEAQFLCKQLAARGLPGVKGDTVDRTMNAAAIAIAQATGGEQ